MPTVPDTGPVLLFDGVCNLCNGTVQFIIPRDPNRRIRFAPLQSETGRELAARCGISTEDLETLVLVEGEACYTRSEAAICVARHLGGVYALAGLLRVVPRPLRDRVYDFVAAHRYQWFGRRESCMVPSPETAGRFLD